MHANWRNHHLIHCIAASVTAAVTAEAAQQLNIKWKETKISSEIWLHWSSQFESKIWNNNEKRENLLGASFFSALNTILFLEIPQTILNSLDVFPFQSLITDKKTNSNLPVVLNLQNIKKNCSHFIFRKKNLYIFLLNFLHLFSSFLTMFFFLWICLTRKMTHSHTQTNN